ncbi:MAG: 16S rRNA (guanine(966)-N(2))-methyltransferase RsmD [Clostridiales bacterium]|nr:16S rRNA (guanine(966)-N(2))-methyltransferase RsmD [Clostridiales bacterium]
MRIIAGELKGRHLTSPTDDRIRPTADKVKESIFNMIAPYVPDSIVLDLFAGTGGLGLEAVSRGAKTVYFVDNSRASLRIINKNISDCRVENRCKVISGDWEHAIKEIPEPADIIVLDPPYQLGLIEKCINKIIELDLISEDGLIVAEHASEESLPDKIGNLTKIKNKKYGSVSITIYTSMEEND